MKKSLETSGGQLRNWWANHQKSLLRIAVVIMALAATIWLAYEFYRLLWQPKQIGFYKVHPGAIDLKIFHNMVTRWSSGKSLWGSVYPTASYVMLWPLLGWLEVKKAVWLWAATSVVTLGWLVGLVVRESGAKTILERTFVGLIPLSMYATGATIGNGQLIVHTLPLLMAGMILVLHKQNTWGRDLLGSILILASLVKPTVTAPFFWIVIFVPGRLRPALLVVIGYIALTLFATFFPEPTAFTHVYNFVKVGDCAVVRAGEANLHIWMASVGLKKWTLHASLLVLVALGAWIYYHRRVNIWLLMGVTAIVARFWIYHRWYDDLLILLPMIALYRTAKSGPSKNNADLVAGVLLAVTIPIMLAPGGLYLLQPPWNMYYVRGQVILWLLVLIFLVCQTRQEKQM